jgi:HEAT repeat protein
LARDRDVSEEERCKAAQALGQLGHTNGAVALLFDMARDEDIDEWARRDAYESLRILLGMQEDENR